MNFKKRVALLLSFCITINIATQTAGAISNNLKQVDEINTTNNIDTLNSIDDKEWFLNDTDVIYEDFKNYIHTVLDIPKNQIILLSDIINYTGDLDIPSHIKGLPSIINKFVNVQNIKIDSSNLLSKYITQELFQEDMQNLKTFSISSNGNKSDIYKLNSHFLQNAPLLEKLSIVDTNITNLPSSVLNNPNLLSVNISNNNIKSLPKNIFVLNNKIKNLDISNNNIIELNQDFFNQNTSLEKIDISGNNIISLNNNYLKLSNKNIIRIEYDNFFIPINDSYPQNRDNYKIISPENISSLNMIKGKEISNELLHSILGKFSVINNKTNIRSTLNSDIPLEFIPTDMSKNYFTKNNIPNKVGKIYGFIKVSNSNNNNLKTNILETSILENNTSSSSLQNIILKEDITLSTNFDPNIYSYNLVVPYGMETVDINAISENDKATITGDIGTISVENGKEISINITSLDKSSSSSYKIKFIQNKIISSDSTLKSIEIDGVLSDFNFDPNIFEYNIDVDNNTDFIKINPIASNDSSILKFNGMNKDIILNNGKNVFTIIVDSPDRSNKSIYILNLNKAENNIDNDGSLLESLSIDNYELMPIFQKDILNYTLEVSSNVSSLKLDASTIAGSSITLPNGKKTLSLKSGLNTFEIKVNSSFGVSRTYTLNILRKSDSENADLSSLKLVDQDGKRISFDRTFNRNTTEYKINRIFTDKDFSEDNFIKIEATSSNSKATIYGAETFVSMDSGKNIILAITVVAEDGITNKTYNINISKEGNSIEYNNDIKNIIPFSDKILIWDKPFSRDTLEYTIVAPFEQTSIGFYIDTYMKSTTIEANFENNIKDLSIGNNIVSFTATSSDGSVKTYSINIIRQSKLNISHNNNNNLMDIKINGISIPDFSPDKKSYTMYMKDSIDEIDISAFSLDPSSKIKTNNLGNQKINDGQNTFHIPITGQDGKENLYSIIINKTSPPSKDLSLTSLQVKDSSTGNSLNIIPVFDSNIGGYTLNVPNDIDSIDIESTAFDTTATIIGNGIHKLITGDNSPISITVKLPDNSEYSYSLIVTREKSNISTLKSLNVSNNSIDIPLDQPFDPIIESYSVTFPYEIDNIDIDAITTNDGATITSGLGNITMDVGLTKVAIVVLSEDGTSTTSYNLDINRKASTDSTLSNLQIYLDDRAIDIIGFDPSITDYEIEVIDFISSGYLIPTVNNEFATFTGDLTSVDLVTGDNKLSITVTAQDGISITVYNLNIIKKKSNVSTLSNIDIALDGIETNMVPSFSSDVLSYNIGSTDASVISIKTTKTNEKSTVTGDGDIDLILGINNIPILVTAEDGTTTTYSIIIEKIISSNAKLKSLQIILDGTNIPIEPTFNPVIFEYKTLNKVYSDSAEIVVIAENNKSTITGDGKISLNDLGDNRNIITVTAEDGSIQNYSVNIIKGASDNANLKTLSVSDITGDLPLDPIFNKDTLEYTLEVENNIDKINIFATAEDSKAKILGIGNNKDLSVGLNSFNIDVSAEDGSTKKYKISITRKGSTLLTDIFLETLDGKDIPLSPNFDPSIKSYKASVENDIDEISILATSDSGTDITGDAGKNKKLDYGNNIISITATNKAGESSEYIIEVTRKVIHIPAVLDSLIVNINGVSQPLTPIFDSSIKEYTLNLPREISKATIYGTNADSRFSISGTGEISLNHGENIITVTVSDTIDPSNTADYIIKINREKANNNTNLADLKFNGYLGLISEGIKDLAYTPTLSHDVIEYQVTISEPKDFTITEILEDSKATITHNRPALLSGRFNIWETIITAEDGVTTKTIQYKIYLQENIASIYDFSPVDDITFKPITLSPTYHDDIKDYTSTVSNETTGIDITLKYYDANKTILITGNKDLKVGTNVITIDITAENPNTRNIYTINVTKEEPKIPAFLQTLSVNDKYGAPISLSPAFDSSIKEYTSKVAYNISEVSPSASADFIYSISGIGNKPLSVGENIIIINVKLTSNPSNNTDYIIKITREEAEVPAFLETLSVTDKNGIEQTLSPLFDSSIKEYTLEVPYITSEINIAATNKDSIFSISGIGNKSLSVGKNIIIINVKSTTNPYNSTDYIIRITRKDSNNNANLADLKFNGYLGPISEGIKDLTYSPSFNPDVTEYSLTVGMSENFDIIETLEDTNATITHKRPKLNPGKTNTWETIITAADGVTTKTIQYKIYLQEDITYFLFFHTFDPINDIDIILSPEYNNDIKDYTSTVKNSTTSMHFLNVPTDNKKNIVITGNENFKVGLNVVTVDITAENQNDKASYTFNVTREEPIKVELSTLSVKNGDDSSNISISPTFNPSILSYDVLLERNVKNVILSATSNNIGAVISGDIGSNIPISLDIPKTLTIIVTNDDGTYSQEYKVNITHKKMIDPSLKELKISSDGNDLPLSPLFSSMIKEYTMNLSGDYKNKTILIEGSTINSGTTITGLGNKTLKTGLNKIEIKTLATDGTSTTYTINITVNKSSNASLASITVTDAGTTFKNIKSEFPLSPKFNPNVLNYSVNSGFTTKKININAISLDKDATIKITDLGKKDLVIGINTFEITVTAEDGITTKTYSIDVEAKQPINDIILNTTNLLDIKVGENAKLNYTINPAGSDEKLKFKSNNTGILTISADGTIKGIAIGTTTVDILGSDGRIIKSIEITIKPTPSIIDPIPDPDTKPNPDTSNPDKDTTNPLTSDKSNILVSLLTGFMTFLGIFLFKKKRDEDAEENK